MNIQTKILIPLVIIFSLMSGIVIYLNYSNQLDFVEKVVEDQAVQTASQYFDSVNAMMITGTMENRGILREKLLENKDITDVRIVRSPEVNEMYGEGFENERVMDDLDKRGLAGEEIRIVQSFQGKRVLSVLVPVKASSNFRGTNCLECHEVPEGTVLGATRITYSLERQDLEVKANSIHMGKMLIGLFIAALVFVVIVLRLIAIKRLKRTQREMQEIATNMDLTKVLSRKNSKDEIEKLLNAFDEMLKNIRESLCHVKTSTEKIVNGTEEITEITDLTVSNILQQKEEIKQVGETLRKMSHSSQTVANNTSQSELFTNTVEAEVADGANQAFSARTKINNLYQKIEQVASIASRLEAETVRIGETVKVVDDITLNTRLLSFNASVEASRANQAGQGFAVVAREIGELAQQTSNSNKDIAECTNQLKILMQETVGLIKDTKKLADEGRSEVNTSYEAFKKVSIEMAKLKEVMVDIAGRTKEQNEATREVETNINSITELSNKTTDAAQRIGEVSNDFAKLTNELNELIMRFKLFPDD